MYSPVLYSVYSVNCVCVCVFFFAALFLLLDHEIFKIAADSFFYLVASTISTILFPSTRFVLLSTRRRRQLELNRERLMIFYLVLLLIACVTPIAGVDQQDKVAQLVADLTAHRQHRQDNTPLLPRALKERLLKAAACGTCRALFSELFLEVRRHKLDADGEEDILDSVEAACMGVVGNYTVAYTPPFVAFSPEHERMSSAGVARGGGSDDGGSDMTLLMTQALLMKEACERTSSDIGMEMSEGVWHEAKRVHGNEGGKSPEERLEQAAQDFCYALEDSGCRKVVIKKRQQKQHRRRRPPTTTKSHAKRDNAQQNKNKQKEAVEASAEKAGSTSSGSSGSGTGGFDRYEELLKKMDSDGSLTSMLLAEQADPGANLPADQKAQLEAGKVALQCPVCRVVVSALVHDLPHYIRESESELIPILENVCRGPEDTSVPSILGIAPPPLPPAWTHNYALQMPSSAAHGGAGKTIDGLDGWSLRERKREMKRQKTSKRTKNRE